MGDHGGNHGWMREEYAGDYEFEVVSGYETREAAETDSQEHQCERYDHE